MPKSNESEYEIQKKKKKNSINFVLFRLFRNPLVWKVASCKNIEKKKNK